MQFNKTIGANIVKYSKCGFVSCIVANTPLMCFCFPYIGTDLC